MERGTGCVLLGLTLTRTRHSTVMIRLAGPSSSCPGLTSAGCERATAEREDSDPPELWGSGALRQGLQEVKIAG